MRGVSTWILADSERLFCFSETKKLAGNVLSLFGAMNRNGKELNNAFSMD